MNKKMTVNQCGMEQKEPIGDNELEKVAGGASRPNYVATCTNCGATQMISSESVCAKCGEKIGW